MFFYITQQLITCIYIDHATTKLTENNGIPRSQAMPESKGRDDSASLQWGPLSHHPLILSV